MSADTQPAAPLQAHDPDRVRALKAKIRDRIGDVRRHLLALRTAMAQFGEDFDLDAFSTAYASDDVVTEIPVSEAEYRELEDPLLARVRSEGVSVA